MKEAKWQVKMIVILIAAICICSFSFYANNTHEDEVDIELSGEFTSTSEQNASLTFFPDELQMNAQRTTDTDGHINIYNSSIEVLIYTDILEVWNGSENKVYHDAILLIDEESMYMDINYYPNFSLSETTVVEVPSQVSLYCGEPPKLRIQDGQVEYQFNTNLNSNPSTSDHARLRINGVNTTARFIDKIDSIYIADYLISTDKLSNYSLKYETLILGGNYSYMVLNIKTHSMDLTDNLVLSASSDWAIFEGVSGKIKLDAVTNDSRIIDTTKELLVHDDSSVLIQSLNDGKFQLFCSLGDYDNLEAEIHGQHLTVHYDHENINVFTFQNFDRDGLWIINGFFGPSLAVGLIAFVFKENILDKIGWSGWSKK
ncbi:MAG: hypothetical protein KAS32_29970 [Candidatus Peribacteraceae bacterium]|nr:hypothetical protein [Candidatus Peribacteraceae bacterium]